MHPLRAVSLSQISEAYSDLSKDERIRVKESLDSFITGDIAYDQCCSVLVEILNTTAPADYVQEILNLPEEPLKNTYEHRDSSKPKLWTQAEDKRLIAGLQRYGNSHWAKICQFVGNNRTRAQCSQRWLRSLNPSINKKKWSPEEEKKLLELVAKKGQQSWSAIAKELGNRCDVQCRYRYRQLKAKRRVRKYIPKQDQIKPEIKTKSEDALGLELEPAVKQESETGEIIDSFYSNVTEMLMPDALIDSMFTTRATEENTFSWLSYADFL